MRIAHSISWLLALRKQGVPLMRASTQAAVSKGAFYSAVMIPSRPISLLARKARRSGKHLLGELPQVKF
jgi:hypothetical protein